MEFKRQTDMRDGRSGFFYIMRYDCDPPFQFPHGPWEDSPEPGHNVTRRSEFTDAPWEDDPWVKTMVGYVSWSVLENPSYSWPWAFFTVRIENSLRYFNKSMPTKVHHMTMSFDGDFCARGEKPEDFERLCRKYHQAKELYRILECDEAFAESPHGEAGEKMRQRFPLYRYLHFRVAKEGTQVLVKRLEERRPLQKLDWLHSRIFIDPPGVQGLPPEEYEKLGDGN